MTLFRGSEYVGEDHLSWSGASHADRISIRLGPAVPG